MTTYLTSDPHFGHANIIRHCARPYKDLAEMNEALLDNWNSVVTPTDTVLILGDFLWKPELVDTIIPLLQGRKFLVPGNHDSVHPMHRGYKKQVTLFQDAGVTVLRPFERLNHKGVRFGLCHFPWLHERGEDTRYPEWSPEKKNYQSIQVLLNGHVHDSWRWQNDCFNVGVDQNNFAPIAIDQILEEAVQRNLVIKRETQPPK